MLPEGDAEVVFMMFFEIFGFWFGSPPKECPKCRAGTHVHGYGEYGGHIMSCEKCEWSIEGVTDGA